MKPMFCEEACRIVAGIANDDVVVITMSAMKVFPGVAPKANFVTCVPLMGGAASLGLGIATARPDIRVWVLDSSISFTTTGSSTAARRTWPAREPARSISVRWRGLRVIRWQSRSTLQKACMAPCPPCPDMRARSSETCRSNPIRAITRRPRRSGKFPTTRSPGWETRPAACEKCSSRLVFR
jgi:hypothetical protein